MSSQGSLYVEGGGSIKEMQSSATGSSVKEMKTHTTGNSIKEVATPATGSSTKEAQAPAARQLSSHTIPTEHAGPLAVGELEEAMQQPGQSATPVDPHAAPPGAVNDYDGQGVELLFFS
jgi:hypothetical protein